MPDGSRSSAIPSTTSCSASTSRRWHEPPMSDRVRVGAVSYLNARPLVFGLAQGLGADRIVLSFDVPSVLASRAAAGELDVALLPSIELARIPDLAVVPGLAIGSFGPCRSVLLVSRRPLGEV